MRFDSDITAIRPRSRPAHILVADDNETVRQYMAEALTDAGYQVTVSDAGDSLLRSLQDVTIEAWPDDGVDLVIADVRMPGRTGLDVVRCLQASGWSTPVILMTAHASEPMVAEARALGAWLFVKPFTVEALREVVLAVLMARPDRQRLGQFRLAG
jgi:DNA-binding response OmpR family regulator